MNVKTAEAAADRLLITRLRAYVALTKPRLTSVVVITSVMGYAIGADVFSWAHMFLLALSGYFITGASNGFNQAIERDLDAMMTRTQNRPLPTGKISVSEACLVSVLMGVSGLILLYLTFNSLAAILGGLALFTYAALYTPLKRYTPWAVFVGAFPGAIPPMLGYVAATGSFDIYAGLLFALQFTWQFPHFWAIAWVVDDDYRKAGFRLLPSKGGKDAQTTFLTLVYTLFLIPVAILPWAFDLIQTNAMLWVALAGALFSIPAFQLFARRSDKSAKVLMFASFFYMPFVLVVYLIDKF